MELGLGGRPALVAAASRGLGKASALALAREGARVAICGRDPGALEATRDEIAEATGSTVVAIPADLSTEGEARRFVAQGAEALGGCHILVTNSGGPRTGRFEELADQDFRAAADVLLFSTLAMAREALPHMRAAGFGRVVVIASLGVKQPIPNLILSNSLRAAVIGWARTLADEVGPDGITVNAVLPQRVMTDRVRSLLEEEAERAGSSLPEHERAAAEAIPVRRFGEPGELGDLVVFLCSERASYLTGTAIPLDGGLYRGLF